MIIVLIVFILPALLIGLLFRSPPEIEAEPEEAYECLRFIQRNRIEACYEPKPADADGASGGKEGV